jgi:glucose-6-phosphate 1-epimerase
VVEGHVDINVAELSQRFAIPGVAEIEEGRGGLPKVVITTAEAMGEIYLHGSQVTSWRPAGAEEVIFLSAHSKFAAGSAIRGGIPVCFPWFRNKLDDPKAPSHGVVRTKAWTLDSIDRAKHTVTVTFSTASDDSTRAWWPHDFHLLHRVTVGAELVEELVMSNTGDSALRFEEALHTYYHVGDATAVRISGLSGVRYLDNTDNNREKVQEGEIMFRAQTDRAYMDTTHAVEIDDPVLGRRIRLEKEHSNSTVVWNPWIEGAKSLSDLGDEEWRNMACVEASNMRACGVDLAAGAHHTMKTRVTIAASAKTA